MWSFIKKNVNKHGLILTFCLGFFVLFVVCLFGFFNLCISQADHHLEILKTCCIWFWTKLGLKSRTADPYQLFSASLLSGEIRSHKWSILRKRSEWIKAHEIYCLQSPLLTIFASKLHFSSSLVSPHAPTLHAPIALQHEQNCRSGDLLQRCPLELN